MSEIEERVYWLGFSVFHGIGPKRFKLLLETFSTAENAWNASEKSLLNVLGPALTKKFVAYRSVIDLLDYPKRLEKANAWFVTSNDPEYPQRLLEISNYPLVLFGKGEKSVLTATKTIGVVGTRKITSYGKHVTEMITQEMVQAGYCIVSGLAMGVDAIAHNTTINEKGKTIAVLGCGVDCCNPGVNQSLYERIISSGSCVISEFPLSQPPTVGSFPSRNRIIAGISQSVVVTEGAIDSGALITASDALKNNRQVFAVPGPITSSLSKGPNKLLREGAKLVASGEDILKELGVRRKSNRALANDIKGETLGEQKIIESLRDEELSFDQLVHQTLFSAAELNMLLSLMEMKGFIGKTAHGNYQLIT